MADGGGVGACFEAFVLGVNPVLDEGSFHIGQGREYPVEGNTDGVVGSIEHLVTTEFIKKSVGTATVSIEDGGSDAFQ